MLNQLSAQLTRRFGDDAPGRVRGVGRGGAGPHRRRSSAQGDAVELVICDQVMPGMKGDRFLEVVHRRWPEVMKVLLTGQAGLESAIYAINNAGLAPLRREAVGGRGPGPGGPEPPDAVPPRAATLRAAARAPRAAGAGSCAASTRWAAASASTVEPRPRAARRPRGGSLASGRRSRGRRGRPARARRSLRWAGAAGRSAGRRGPAGDRGLPRPPPRRGPRRRRRTVPDRACSAFPSAHGRRLFGWLFLRDGRARRPGRRATSSSVLAEPGRPRASTAVRLLEERLASERLSTIGRMISTIVHDFRNPMTAIKGYAGMFEEFDLPASDRRSARG